MSAPEDLTPDARYEGGPLTRDEKLKSALRRFRSAAINTLASDDTDGFTELSVTNRAELKGALAYSEGIE